MLGFSVTSALLLLLLLPPISGPLPAFFNNSKTTPLFLSKTPLQNTRNRRRFAVFAANDNGMNKGQNEKSNNGFSEKEDLKKDQRPIFNISWKDLLNPDPENVVAIGLTGLLTWASVSVLWQLFFITSAILLAALKYSFIAALLIFILITLL